MFFYFVLSTTNRVAKITNRLEEKKYWDVKKKEGARKYQEKRRKKVLVPVKKSTLVLRATPKRVYKIKTRSKKRAKQEREYNKRAPILKKENPECQVKWEGCTGFTQHIHHPEGRIGALLTDESKFVYCCSNCHHIIEMNPNRAKEEGFSALRLK